MLYAYGNSKNGGVVAKQIQILNTASITSNNATGLWFGPNLNQASISSIVAASGGIATASVFYILLTSQECTSSWGTNSTINSGNTYGLHTQISKNFLILGGMVAYVPCEYPNVNSANATLDFLLFSLGHEVCMSRSPSIFFSCDHCLMS